MTTINIAPDPAQTPEPKLEAVEKQHVDGSTSITVDTTQKPKAPEAPKAERPAWLPEEFESPEAFVEAYKALKPAEKPAETPSTPEAAVEKAGLDLGKLSEEYAKDQKLSDASYGALEKAGITREVVDAYIEGQKAQGALVAQQLAESVGGQEVLDATLKWAGSNLSAEEIASTNKALQSGDVATAKLVLAGLNSRRVAVEGQDPVRRVQGSAAGGSAGITPYESTAQWISDVNSREYRTDPAFRERVARRISVSRI